MTAFLAPIVNRTFLIPGGNTPGSGVQLFCYAAGTSTKQTVYTTSSGLVPWANPIVLDSGGNLGSGGEVWIAQGVPMKFVYAPSNDTDPPVSPYAGQTYDGVTGINDVTVNALEWTSGPAPTFISASSFSVGGDQTGTFTPGRRLKTTNTGGTIYSTVSSSALSNSSTTVLTINDSANLDSGLNGVSYGMLTASPNGSVPWEQQTSSGPAFWGVIQAHAPITMYSQAVNEARTSVSSATVPDIWTNTGNIINYTGTTATTGFSSAPQAGARRALICASTVQFVSSASMLFQGNANYTSRAGDRIDVVAESTTVFRLYVMPNAPAFNGESLVLLASSAAASSTSLDFTTGFTDQFDLHRMVIVSLVPSSTNTILQVRLSTSAGASFDASANYFHARITQGDDGVTPGGGGTAINTSDTRFALITSVASLATAGLCGHIDFYDLASSTMTKRIMGQASCRGSANSILMGMFGGEYNLSTTPAINGVRLMMDSQLINKAKVYWYGVRRF